MFLHQVDNWLPCLEAGLPFKVRYMLRSVICLSALPPGFLTIDVHLYFTFFVFPLTQCRDVLRVVDETDGHWWQASLLGARGPVGLVPSRMLQDR